MILVNMSIRRRRPTSTATPKSEIGDTGTVGRSDLISLRLVLAVLSLMVMFVVVSPLTPSGGEASSEPGQAAPDNGSGPSARGHWVEITDRQRSVALLCDSVSTDGEPNRVTLQNRGSTAAWFNVAVTLTDRAGRSSVVTVAFPSTQPTQGRRQVADSDQLSAIESCRINSIESDRWLVQVG